MICYISYAISYSLLISETDHTGCFCNLKLRHYILNISKNHVPNTVCRVW